MALEYRPKISKKKLLGGKCGFVRTSLKVHFGTIPLGLHPPLHNLVHKQSKIHVKLKKFDYPLSPKQTFF